MPSVPPQVIGGLPAGGTTAQRPSNPPIGHPYFDTTLGQQLVFNGSAWVGQSPGGSNTQVQFNDGGLLGGDAGLAFIKATGTLLVTQIGIAESTNFHIANDGSGYLSAGDFSWDASGNITALGLTLTSLPTSDPHVLGQLWNSTGTVKISAGP